MKALTRTLRDYYTSWTKNMSKGLSGSDLTPVMTIWHDGSATEDGTEVYSAQINIGSNDIDLYINGELDARIGADPDGHIDYDVAAMDEYGNVCDHINSVVGWCCRLESVLRSDRIYNSNTKVADTLSAPTDCYQKGVTLVSDVGNSKLVGFCISNRKIITTNDIKGSDLDKVSLIENEWGAANILEYIRNYIDATGALTLTLYSVNGTTETLMGTKVLTVDTDQNIDFTAAPFVAMPGCRLIGRIIAGTDMEDDPPLTLEVVGKSIGGRANE